MTKNFRLLLIIVFILFFGLVWSDLARAGMFICGPEAAAGGGAEWTCDDADFVCQSFEGEGYDNSETWNETEVGDSLWDADHAHSQAYPCDDTNEQDLQYTAGAGDNAINVYDGGSAFDDLHLAFWVLIDDHDLANNEHALILSSCGTDNCSVICYSFGIHRTGGTYDFYIRYYNTSAGFTIDYSPSTFSVNTWYQIEISWDASESNWEWWVDDVSAGSGSTAGDRDPRYLMLGDLSTTIEAHIELDNIKGDATAMPDICP